MAFLGSKELRVAGEEVNVVFQRDQHVLQREDALHVGVEVVLGHHPVVPVGEGEEQADGRDGRQGDGQHDLSEDTQLACAVDLGRFNDRLRHGRLEERAHDDHVEAGAADGQNQRPVGVLQAQDVDVDHVAGYQTAAEEHGDQNEDGEELAQAVVGTAERIAHGGAHHQTQAGAHNSNKNGVEEGLADVGALLEQVFIAGHAPCGGEVAVADGSNGFFSRERYDQHQQSRHEAQQCKENEQCGNRDIGSRLNAVEFHQALKTLLLLFLRHGFFISFP